MPHVLPISFPLTHLNNIRFEKAPHYVVFSSPQLLSPFEAEIFPQNPILKNTQAVLLGQCDKVAYLLTYLLSYSVEQSPF